MARTNPDDIEFMSDLRGAVESGPSIGASVLFLLIFGFVVSAIVWANYAELDEVTTGDGRVIPSSQIQVVQNLEGGILLDLHVKEGQIVEPDEILLSIDDTIAGGKLREDVAKVLALEAMIIRLEAERDGVTPEFPDSIMSARPDLAESELALYRARTSELASALDVFENQISQRRQEMVETQGRISQLGSNLILAKEELSILEPLVEQGVSAKIELIRLQRQINEIAGDLEAAEQSMPRLRSAMNEAQRRREERRGVYDSQVATDLSKARGEFASIRETMNSSEDRVRRTEVRSPVRGTVNKILINTVGGVIRPGDDLVEIVPIEDNLLVEARIRPSDVAFLHPGQEAQVKITAYDFSIFGGLEAELELISSDTIMDEDGERYYEIRVRTDETHLTSKDNVQLPIIPGMVAEVDILTGKKTVLDYLMKPILRAQGKALRER